MNWMLVLFMGLSPHYSIVKTDLVFKGKGACLSFANQLSKDSADAINANIKQLSERGASEAEINSSITWTGMQTPGGACIPTTTAVTVN